MSFGFSPSDVIKLVEITTRVYIAFKDANENSETQVESLWREFQTFARCLLELDNLMKEFGQEELFSVEDFKKILYKCEESLKPYVDKLCNQPRSFGKVLWTVKFIGKEKELEILRKQITGQYQALNLCLQFLQLRLNLESSRREQRLLLEPHHRSRSLAGQWYTSGASSSAPQSSPLALPAPEDAHPLYKDWEILNRWLKSEHDQIDEDHVLVRPPHLCGDTPAAPPSSNDHTAAMLYRLRCEVEDALVFEENRAKRSVVEKRSHLAPSDAMKQQVREMPPAPHTYPRGRVNTIGSDDSYFADAGMNQSAATIKPASSSPSPNASPSASPQIEHDFFRSSEWTQSPSPSLPRSSFSSMASDGRLSPTSGLGIHTADTTPENALPYTLRTVFSHASLNTLSLGEGALEWNKLCHNVWVERKTAPRAGSEKHGLPSSQSQKCDVHWRRREDGGMSLRAVYRSETSGQTRPWIRQDFTTLGPSIPLTTTIGSEICMDFPRGSFGRLDKQWIDVNYRFEDPKAAAKFQTLLYTNNGMRPAELLFDKPIKTISSDKQRECLNKNLRLWHRSEMHLDPNGPVNVAVLVLLFYTSHVKEKGQWVEEPHYAFEVLKDSTYGKTSEKLTLEFCKRPATSTSDKLFRRRKSSQVSAPTSPIRALRKDSMEIPGITRSGTNDSTGSLTASVRTSQSIFSGRSGSSRLGNVNQHGYARLEIEFGHSKDRKEFLQLWRRYPKPTGDGGV